MQIAAPRLCSEVHDVETLQQHFSDRRQRGESGES